MKDSNREVFQFVENSICKSYVLSCTLFCRMAWLMLLAVCVGGIGLGGPLRAPVGIAADANNVYVANTATGTIVVFNKNTGAYVRDF